MFTQALWGGNSCQDFFHVNESDLTLKKILMFGRATVTVQLLLSMMSKSRQYIVSL